MSTLSIVTNGLLSSGAGTVIIGGDRKANLMQALNASLSQALSANIAPNMLTSNKLIAYSTSISTQTLEATICQQ